MLIYEGGETIKKYPFTKQRGIKDCGPACVQMIVKYYKGYISLDKLGEMMNTNQNGTTAYNIKQTLNNIGFKSYGIKSQNIKDLKLPCIAHVIINHSYTHYIVIYKINLKKNTILIADPAIGLKTIPFQEFIKIWSKVTIQMYPVEHIVRESKPKILKFIWRYLKKNLSLFILIQITSLLINIFSIIGSFYLPVIIYNYASHQLYKICYIYIILFTIKHLLIITKNKMQINFDLKLEEELSKDIFYKVLNLPYRYYRYKTTGEITNYFNELYIIRNAINNIIQISVFELFLIIIIVLLLLKINYKVLLITLILLITLFLITLAYYKKQKTQSNKLNRQKSIITSYIVEHITGFETIKNLNIENKIHDSFINKIKTFIKTKKQLYISEEKSKFLKNIINDIGIIILSISIMNIHKNNLNNFIITFVLSSLLISYIKSILEYDFQINEIKYALNNIVELIDKKSENLKQKKSDANIIIKNLNYSFNENKKTLHNINLKIKKSNKVMVTGNSGSGKSTLFKIIKGYYKDYEGSVKINNTEIRNYNFKDIVYVSQKETLFTGTLIDNLNLKNDNNNSKEICEINEFAKNKYQLIEEDGFNLSGGQKQRIVLARALSNFNILIIDEGLSQVSIDMERRILKKIFNIYHNKTIIYISHRIDNLDLFDQLIEIRNGKVIKDVTRNN